MTSPPVSETRGGYGGMILVFAGIFVVVYLVVSKRGRRGGRLPPSLRSVPILGSMPFLPDIGQLPAFFQRTSSKLGPVFGFYLGSEYVVVLNSRDSIDEALLKHALPFAGRKVGYTGKHIYNVNNNGIIAKPYGPEFRKIHQLTLSILREFGVGRDLMEERIHTEAEELVALISQHEGQPFYPAQLLSMCALNVIASVIFGQRLGQQDPKLNQLARDMHASMKSKIQILNLFPVLRFLPGFKGIIRRWVAVRDSVHAFIAEGVQRSLTCDDHSFVKEFVARQGADYDKAELRHTLEDLLAAGSETTASSLQWALVLLANDRTIQKRLQKELDSVVPEGRLASSTDLAKLPYVKAAILELTRCKTVVSLALPHVTQEDTEVQGFFVPKDTRVIPNLYSVHLDPKEWPEPEVYRPERFLDEAGSVVGRNRLIPFSRGKRSCLGEFLARQELFLLFTALVQNFDILPPDGHDRVEHENNFFITLCPSPFQVRLVPRQRGNS